MINHTPLHALHLEHGARMVSFAGYSMPMQYAQGILHEHRHVRQQTGLFDVSHMGQFELHTHAETLERLMPQVFTTLPVGCQRYAFLTNEAGGILDDLMVMRLGEQHWRLVLNAACQHEDIAHLRAHCAEAIEGQLLDHALLALQGPMAANQLAKHCAELETLPFMHSANVTLCGIECMVSRSGYTGEDGYEISVPAAQALDFAQWLLTLDHVELAGLGARDLLRLEAGLCLYGQDIHTQTTPVEANLTWAMQKRRREQGGFPGAEVIQQQLQHEPSRRRVGLIGSGRIAVRGNQRLLDHNGHEVGRVTSGAWSPSLEAPIAMAYLDTDYLEHAQSVMAEVRRHHLQFEITTLPFVPQRYYRRPQE